MLHVGSVCTPCCMLLDVIGCCCAKFEIGQIFQPTTSNTSFVPWSPKRSATMLDPFTQLFQYCWGHARWLRMVYKDLWVVSFPTMYCRSQHCWELLHPFADHCQYARNNVGTGWPTIMRPFARYWKFDRFQTLPSNTDATTSNKMQQGVQTDPTCNNDLLSCARLHGSKSLTGFKLCATTGKNIQQNVTGCANGRIM